MILGLKNDGDLRCQVRTAAGEALPMSILRTEAAVIPHFQMRMPAGCS
jgi:hypothetical protein